MTQNDRAKQGGLFAHPKDVHCIAYHVPVDLRFVDAMRRDDALSIPPDLDYGSISGLSNEIREKLEQYRPETLGQAGRIDGVTPAALVLLLSVVRRKGSHGAPGVHKIA